jgi:hypothetical protein
MTDDLVKRMRAVERDYDLYDHDIIYEAADRIEELEKAFKETILAFDKTLYSSELTMEFSHYCMTIQDSNKHIVGLKNDD